MKKAAAHFDQAYRLAEPCRWFDVDDDACEIRYMTGNTRYHCLLLCCGAKETLMRRERGIEEKPVLRKGTRNYYKLFYQNGRLLKVEDYIEGELRKCSLCFYTENARVLMPFELDKTNTWWHYCIVTWFSSSGQVEKEVWLDEQGLQVVYSEYVYKGDRIEYENANCLPQAVCDRVQYIEHGVFYDNGTRFESLD